MRPSETQSQSVLLEAVRLIEGATSLIEFNGWWNGKPDEVDPCVPEQYRTHCAASALDAAGFFFNAAIYQTAFDAIYSEIPEDFRMTYASHSRYMVLTMYNDDHDKEFILALLRRASAKLKKEAELVNS